MEFHGLLISLKLWLRIAGIFLFSADVVWPTPWYYGTYRSYGTVSYNYCHNL